LETSLQGYRGGGLMAENWHKRQALQLACQLPENAEDARAILREVQDLVDTWLHVEKPAPSKVVSMVRDPA
jgi:hypothetical protein